MDERKLKFICRLLLSLWKTWAYLLRLAGKWWRERQKVRGTLRFKIVTVENEAVGWPQKHRILRCCLDPNWRGEEINFYWHRSTGWCYYFFFFSFFQKDLKIWMQLWGSQIVDSSRTRVLTGGDISMKGPEVQSQSRKWLKQWRMDSMNRKGSKNRMAQMD